jgi:hypothetical protein
MVIGAQVFRTELLQITSDPGLAGAAPVGET